MKVSQIAVTAGALLVVAAAVWYFRLPMPAPPPSVQSGLPAPCVAQNFEGVGYIVCKVVPGEFDMVLRRTGLDGKPLQKLDRLAEIEPFVFAMNAGMYHEDFSPVGLYVEDGHELSPLNTGDAPGNFFMKPNGVFFIDAAGRAGVLETDAYAAAKPAVAFATQSGPMLVIDGKMHPRFEPDGQSKYIRNGVGVDKAGVAFFAISQAPVSLGSFARLFRDALSCSNALFFDGAISALHDGRKHLVGGEYPAGPIVSVKIQRGQ